MARRTDRRAFIRAAASAAAGVVILGQGASARTFQANKKLNVALIGVGGRGQWFVGIMPKLSNVVAICDVSDSRATVALRTFPKLPRFYDYRLMFDKMAKGIDAVVVATPDHSNAPASLTAMRHGKGVYCEKPLTRTVGESRVMRLTARDRKVATQMGNQGTASGGYRRSVELIQDGVLGKIEEVYIWNGNGGNGWTQPPKGTEKVPYYLKWDLWLGPAAHREFHSKWMAWHGWRDFGTSQLGNWASHSANLAFRALKVDALWQADADKPHPILTVEAKVSEVNRLSFPRWESIRFGIPARGELPPITLQWLNGPGDKEMRARVEKHVGKPLDWTSDDGDGWKDHAGTLIVGGKGSLKSNAHNTTFSLLPEKQFKDVDLQPQRSPRSRGHEQEWLDACAGGPPAWSNFDYAGPLEELLMLGNVATQFPGKLEYDTVTGKIVNNPQADEVLRPVYRKGWTL